MRHLRHLVAVFFAFGMPNEGGVEARLIVFALFFGVVEMGRLNLDMNKKRRQAAA